MTSIAVAAPAGRPIMPVLIGLSVAHCLNDVLQSLIPAVYPVLKEAYRLDFAQIGLITLAFQLTSSLLQPLVGFVTDARPWPYAMVAGMCATLAGLLGLSVAADYATILCCAALVGSGSAVFHPEATRMARYAAAGRQGLAQGVFQIGGHLGYSAGPLLAAAVVVPRGQGSLSWFSAIALVALVLMARIATLSSRSQIVGVRSLYEKREGVVAPGEALRTVLVMAVLIVLLFSKNAYGASFTSYYTFYLIERFGITVQLSQVMLFAYLVVGAAGVIVGGVIGDRIGRDRAIWISIVGSLPFALALPHVGLVWTAILSVVVSFVMASAFSSILIYAIDLVPHRVGLVGGLFYGLAFGLGGIAAAALGVLADRVGIVEVFRLCAWLPAIGLLTFLLPRASRAGGTGQDAALP